MVVETIYNGNVIHKELYYTTQQAKNKIHAERRKNHMEKRKAAVEVKLQKMLGLILLIIGFVIGKVVMGDAMDSGGQMIFLLAGFTLLVYPKSLRSLTNDFDDRYN